MNVDLFQPRATGSAGKGHAVKSPESIPLFLSDMTPGVGGGTFKSASWRNSLFAFFSFPLEGDKGGDRAKRALILKR